MNKRRQQGFGYIAAIVIVVVLSALGVAAARLSTTQQTGANQDLLSSRAWQAARAGTEWGMYRALRQQSCAAATTINVGNGFNVTVKCDSAVFFEGEVENPPGTVQPQSKTAFTITATACNSAACPDNARAVDLEYTERSRVVTACSLNDAANKPNGKPC
ncbi:MSHA biogenesis protein MshP [Pseudoduganella eburnea]|uniref:MSHA biogenesis protein MshP n=1 Tax=Massilia eburnea TaxID=1776165 RepID=A0A6L6QMX9_9BURK|nr:MSHA biogenesis protein MshP [Massilia eburnea]MTW13732.1 MSHA biogenesis protein MshP [Massilia eburnea]